MGLKINIQKRTVLQYILIYCMFMTNESLLYAMNHEIYYYAFFFFAIAIAAIYNIHILKDKHVVLCGIVFILSLAFNRFTNDGGIGIGFFFRFASKALIVYVAYHIDKKKILPRFIRTLAFFSAVSLCFFSVSQFLPELVKVLLGYSYTIDYSLVYTNWTSSWSYVYYGKFLYAYLEGARNSGIYTEPGLYQMILISGIYILLFMPEKIAMSRKKIRNLLLLFIVTMFTTMSATGYICLAIVFGGVLFYKNRSNDNRLKSQAVNLFLGAMVFLVIDYYMKGEDSFLKQYLFGKIGGLGNKEIGFGSASGDARLVMIEIALFSIVRYPFGAGINNFTSIASNLGYSNILAGNGLFYFLSVLGIVGWLSVMLYVIVPAYKNKENWTAFIVFMMIYLVSITSQQYIFAPGFLLISLITQGDVLSNIVRRNDI